MQDPNWYISHTNSELPGQIHEGGELGYALAVSFGAVMDKPELIVTCIVGGKWNTKKEDARSDGAEAKSLTFQQTERLKLVQPQLHGMPSNILIRLTLEPSCPFSI